MKKSKFPQNIGKLSTGLQNTYPHCPQTYPQVPIFVVFLLWILVRVFHNIIMFTCVCTFWEFS